MSNLTIAIDPATLKKARLRALQEGTSVNALLRHYLVAYAGTRNEQQEAVQDLLALGKASAARRGGQAWNRADLHRRGQ